MRSVIAGALFSLIHAFASVTLRVIQFTLQPLGEPWSNIPSSLLAMLPFALAIIAMIVLTSGKRARFLGAPAALGLPYFREQR